MKPLVFLSDEVSLLRARSEVLFLKRAEKREAAWSVRALHAADSYVCKSRFGATRVRVGTESKWLHDDTAAQCFDMKKPEAGIASAVVLVPAHLPFPSTASKGDMADEARFLEAACFSN